MYIKSISFEIMSDDINWKIDNLEFNQINLISGKNASGKTRVLNSIFHLITLMRGKSNVGKEDLSWRIKLIENEIAYIYDLKIKNQLIFHEELLKHYLVYQHEHKEVEWFFLVSFTHCCRRYFSLLFFFSNSFLALTGLLKGTILNFNKIVFLSQLFNSFFLYLLLGYLDL